MPRTAGAFLAALLLAAGPLGSCTAAAEVLGLSGEKLKTCSKPGTAMTGFTRDGKCQDLGDDDAGSHHICIQMKDDFCTQTGQPNWCADEMPCMGQDGGESADECPIGNWCVCQWAFARYIQMAGGCDAIVDLQCDATNLAALKAYEAQKAEDKSIQDALDCIKQKCPSTVSSLQGLSDVSMKPPSFTSGWSATGAASALCLVLVAAAVVFLVAARRRAATSPQAWEWSVMSGTGL